jgi:hypothetical protein
MQQHQLQLNLLSLLLCLLLLLLLLMGWRDLLLRVLLLQRRQ